jgi:hypothetical protein
MWCKRYRLDTSDITVLCPANEDFLKWKSLVFTASRSIKVRRYVKPNTMVSKMNYCILKSKTGKIMAVKGLLYSTFRNTCSWNCITSLTTGYGHTTVIIRHTNRNIHKTPNGK